MNGLLEHLKIEIHTTLRKSRATPLEKAKFYYELMKYCKNQIATIDENLSKDLIIKMFGDES